LVTREYYRERVSAGLPEEESEPALESIVAYLLKNRVADRIVEMALYEQFSLPGLDNASQSANVVRNHAVKFLEEMMQHSKNGTRLIICTVWLSIASSAQSNHIKMRNMRKHWNFSLRPSISTIMF